MFRGPSRIFGSGQLALPDVREMSEVPSGHPGVVGGSPGCSGVMGDPLGCPEVVWMPCQMSGSDRETRPQVREPIPDVRECTRDHLECPGVVERPSRMSGRPSRLFGSD